MTFEKFTDRARKVFQRANKAAVDRGHASVGTEHVLLGLLEVDGGVATSVLKNLGIDDRLVAITVDDIVKAGNQSPEGRLRHTPRTKRVVELALNQARELDFDYVGTEHILLGLLLEPDGVAGHVLRDAGMTFEKTREEILNLLGKKMPEPGTISPLHEVVVKNGPLARFMAILLVEYMPAGNIVDAINTATTNEELHEACGERLMAYAQELAELLSS